jgi:hypothetical protein
MDFKPVIDHLQNRLPKLLGCMPSAAGWSAVGKTHGWTAHHGQHHHAAPERLFLLRQSFAQGRLSTA